MYYKLRCVTCNVDFKPLRATEPGELLYPDYERSKVEAGCTNAEALELFHLEHRGHCLEEVKVEAN
jgi:hypothetical protein